MKSKLVVILLLIGFLIFTVKKMIDYENSIREDHIIKLYIEDVSKPLFKQAMGDELKDFAEQSTYHFKTGHTYFNILSANENTEAQWKPVFLKGVNLGVAIPGKFPAEFSLSFNEYLQWLEQIGKMNVNVIRIYTIFPPEFYKAFAYYNLHHGDHPVYLMHGVWAKVPADEDYFNTAYNREFKKEIIDVIDVIHGNAVLKEQPGKAHGIYATDISDYVIGFLLGREWEPKSVFHTIQKHNQTHYAGNFVGINNGNAMEVWLAKMLDFTALYETQTYKEQHPLSFVNWLPLDPMFHNTEFIENEKVREYDNDLVSIDFEKFNTTPLLHTGIYAAYHVYPYYPDFINLQKEYVEAIDNNGKKNNYYGYLKDLKNHTRGMPLVIAEYGLPSSRGNSHFSPSGFHQGGHSESQQAKLSLQLTQDIYQTDCAGAIYFEWADEWFKHNWLVMDFEIPFEDRKLWHNMENPEQNFGIIALESQKPDLHLNPNEVLTTAADPAYFYLKTHLPDFDFARNNLYIAIDTYSQEKGDQKLPFSDEIFENGFEFLCRFYSPDSAKIQVDEPYSVFTDIYNDYIPVYASKNNTNGKFIDELLLSNRGRETLTGEKTDSIILNRSKLVFGIDTLPDFSNADWYWNDTTKMLDLRLTWHLINVSDPAKRMVLDDKPQTKSIEASKTEGFNIYLFVTDKKDKILYRYPPDKPYFTTWNEWTQPEFKQRKKPIYHSLQKYFENLRIKNIPATENKQVADKFEIADFYKGKKGLISISFDNAMFSQYDIAYPVLNKYGLKASYSIRPEIVKNVVPSILKDTEGESYKSMGISQIKELKHKGNDLAWQFFKKTDITGFTDEFYKGIQSFHMHDNKFFQAPNTSLFVRKSAGKDVIANKYKGIKYYVMPLHFTPVQLDSLLKKYSEKWLIFVYHNLYKKENNGKIPGLSQALFERQIRLMRNSNYAIMTETDAFKYLMERKASRIRTKSFGNALFLRVENNLNPYLYNHPLTIAYTTHHKRIKITGAVDDGIYENHTGTIYFNVYSGKEIKIDVLSE